MFRCPKFRIFKVSVSERHQVAEKVWMDPVDKGHKTIVQNYCNEPKYSGKKRRPRAVWL